MTTLTERDRPELFPVPGAIWDDVNNQVLAPTLEIARAVEAVLVEHGYYLASSSMVDTHLYVFTYHAGDDRNHGRAGGANESVQMIIWTPGSEHLEYEVVYGSGDGPSVRFDPAPYIRVTRVAEYMTFDLEEWCKRDHPDAYVQTRPTLHRGRQPQSALFCVCYNYPNACPGKTISALSAGRRAPRSGHRPSRLASKQPLPARSQCGGQLWRDG